jgi:serine protease Do
MRKLLLVLASCLAAGSAMATTDGVNLLEQTSQTFTKVAKKAMPATVYIKVLVTPNGMERQLPPQLGDEFFRRFFGTPFEPGQLEPQVGAGSGFLISAEGHIVTNYHVIRDGASITVVLNDGREFEAKVVGSDPRTDIAVLKIEGDSFPYLKFGNSDKLEVGEWVIAVGNPFALESSLTVGVVSAKGRQDLGIAAYEDFIQTDAAINRGNSGGPLLDLKGNVVGVNTAIYSPNGSMTGNVGVSFSIPSRMVDQVVDQIIHGGHVTRSYLGVVLQAIDKELAEALDLKKQRGLLISDVIKGSPAAKAGLKQGDIILEYNGKKTKQPGKFRTEVGMMTPGTQLDLTILRKNKKGTFKIALEPLDDLQQATAEALQKLGIEVENLTPELATKLGYPAGMQGVVISKLRGGSPAALAGLKTGFLVTGAALNWNQQIPIVTTTDFDQALKDLGTKRHMILVIRHQNYQRYYTLKLQ